MAIIYLLLNFAQSLFDPLMTNVDIDQQRLHISINRQVNVAEITTGHHLPIKFSEGKCFNILKAFRTRRSCSRVPGDTWHTEYSDAEPWPAAACLSYCLLIYWLPSILPSFLHWLNFVTLYNIRKVTCAFSTSQIRCFVLFCTVLSVVAISMCSCS